jgi:hypothetical protein
VDCLAGLLYCSTKRVISTEGGISTSHVCFHFFLSPLACIPAHVFPYDFLCLNIIFLCETHTLPASKISRTPGYPGPRNTWTLTPPLSTPRGPFLCRVLLSTFSSHSRRKERTKTNTNDYIDLPSNSIFKHFGITESTVYLARLVKMVRRRDDGQLVGEDDGIVAVKGYILVGEPPLCA